MDVQVTQGIVKVSNVQHFLEKWKDFVFLNADYIVDENHAYFAAEKAVKAWNEGRNVAKSLPMEVILYAAATRQINKALVLGLSCGVNKVVVVSVNGKSLDNLENVLKKCDVLFIDEKKINRILKFFDINSAELSIVGLNKLSLLVRERIVLFDIFK